ncbi:Tim44/TimA family putative adaptor protein [Alteriqipengyuania flavescens]|uniref:Tim44/TimA family putative adaptor protein n=1 Tax=Alteriqipengyuania flavescens TaxID=3053610 RepID=UPI0025B58FCA|nr:Tim44/TimA family putative adaptor protein [Alteriqipengyuania flavescens]WJY17463.1 Tim44/TimA family putative adaptor protein [Alteriqipengyuania flavescens]WJY23406.1 Tim44/TimA family putative adaptor protein [Alteriqipengyuania flavescens]
MFWEIIILAMIAAFLGLRLYSVLGQRAEHEEEPSVTRLEQPREQQRERPAEAAAPQGQQAMPQFSGVTPAIERGLREISAADRQFDLLSFLEGAKGAYSVVLEAFWEGDREDLRELTDADVYAGFEAAIAAREEAGETLRNSLVRIEDAVIHSAELDGSIARITVRFIADIAAVTYDKDGNVVAGSLDDAIESVDVWTFERDTRLPGPKWLVTETDEG